MRLLATLGCLLALAGAARAAPAPGGVDYSLSPVMEQGALAAFEVRMRFAADADGETRLTLPQEWGGGEKLWRFVSGLRIAGATSVTEDGPAVRLIRSRPGTSIEVSYRLANPQPTDPPVNGKDFAEPIVRPDWAYLIGYTAFADVDGRGAQPARVSLQAPPGWKVATDLAQLEQSGATADTVQQSATLMAPDLRVLTRMDQGAPVRVAIRGHFGFKDEDFADLAFKVVQAERAFWKARPKPFLVTVGPFAPVASGSSFRGTNLVDSFGVISTANLELDTLRVLLAHEYFHTWNSTELGGLAQGPKEPEGYWFSEGFTDFYARRLALRAGLVDLDGFVNAWNDGLAEYHSSGVRNTPNAEIAASFWSNPEMNRLPYGRGAVFAALMERRLREATAGRRDMDQVMFEMQRLAAAAPKAQEGSAADLFAPAVRAVAGIDAGPEIERYMVRGETLLLPEDAFGGCIKVRTLDLPVFDRGFDGTKSAETGVIAGVDPDGPAYAAGLRDGFKRIGREGGKDGDSRVEIGYRVVDASGAERLIRYRPEGRSRMSLQELAVTPGLGSGERSACARQVAGG
jgi:predicted metalloprotease with PDZ domain